MRRNCSENQTTKEVSISEYVTISPWPPKLICMKYDWSLMAMDTGHHAVDRSIHDVCAETYLLGGNYIGSPGQQVFCTVTAQWCCTVTAPVRGRLHSWWWFEAEPGIMILAWSYLFWGTMTLRLLDFDFEGTKRQLKRYCFRENIWILIWSL